MIELYTHPMSPCVQKVRILLAEKGLDWQRDPYKHLSSRVAQSILR